MEGHIRIVSCTSPHFSLVADFSPISPVINGSMEHFEMPALWQVLGCHSDKAYKIL
jgi:hypothetical protein